MKRAESWRIAKAARNDVPPPENERKRNRRNPRRSDHPVPARQKTISPSVSVIWATGDRNTLSKSTLILAAHALTESLPECRYFPAYEILMDDLRDYRFYERDMVHPSETAVEYIWEAFRRNVLDERDNGLLDRAEALRRAMEHRPFDPSGEAHRWFRSRQAEEARALQRQYPEVDFSEEINFFES
ncbi:MAG: GSCFA domain-containing protein [Alistipes sp.]